MNDVNNKYQLIIHKIKNTKNYETLYLCLGAFGVVLSLVLISVLCVSIIESFAKGDTTFRTILMSLILISGISGFIIYVVPVILRFLGIKNNPSDEEIALRIGSIYPEIKDNLCNGIQLVSANSGGVTSENLAEAAFEQIYSISSNKDFNKIIDKNRFKKSIFLFLIIASITFGIFSIFSSSIGSAFIRITNFNKSFLPPAPYSLKISPESKNVLRGESVKIIVKADGKAPESINLLIKEDNQENFDSYLLKLDSSNSYNFEISSIKRSISFYAESFWLNQPIHTNEINIKVIDKPSVKAFYGNLIFPSYTNLAPKSFNEQTADIAGLKGTKAEFQLFASKSLSDAYIVFEAQNTLADAKESNNFINQKDTTIYKLNVDDKKVNGSMMINRTGTYHFHLTDKEGLSNDDPIKYSIVATNDDYPLISLIEPQTDVQVTETAKLPIRIAISDDYGFSGLKLFFRLSSSKYTSPAEKFSSVNIPLLSSGLTMEVPYLWDLNSVNISPEDRYEFYLEVYDNDKVSGPKSSKTQTLTVRLPSLDEVLHEADNDQNKTEKELEKALKQAEEIKKDVEQLNRELLKNTQKNAELDWKEKKKAEDIMKKQSELQNKMSDIQKNLEDLTQKLQQNNALSPETLQKYQELQKLLKEVNSPELKKLQESMQQAMNKMSQDEMQKMMKNFKFDEEQFKKSIERTLKILKRLQAEQKVDALTKRAEELQKKMEEMDKKLQNANPNDKQKKDDLANQQKNMQDDLKNISEDMKDLEKLMKEIGDNMPMKEMDKAKDELKPEETSQDMQESEKSTKDGDFNKASKSQKKASQQMKKFADQMKKLKQEMNNKVTKEAMKKMQKAISDLLQLSKNEENLKSKTQNSDYNSTQIPDIAQSQEQINDALQNVANSMMELSQKSLAVTPEMGKSLGQSMQQMEQAQQNLANRSTTASANNMEQAMSSMNNAAMQMQSMLSQMQNKGSGSCDNPGGTGQGSQSGQGSFMDKLNELAGKQQGINQGMQQFGDNNKGKLSQEQQAQIGKMASEQGKAQQALDDLIRNQKEQGGEKKSLGDLQKIAKEMQEVLSDLQSGKVTPETMKKQDRILSRLLDATKSVNERDFEKKRESREGKDMVRQSPGSLNMDTQEGKTRALQEMLKSIQQGYTKDYEELIRQYFESIQKTNVKMN